MSLKKNKSTLRDNCLTALQIIGEEMRRASDKPHPGEMAWGQYLDYDHSTDQTGVYGSATVVLTLAILGEPIDSDYIKGGLEWLKQSYYDKQSRANLKNDWAIIYKLCYFLEAIDPNVSEINEHSNNSELFRTLIARRLPDDGWGEYYFNDNDKDPKFSLIATAMALYVLRRYIPFSGSSLAKETALSFCNNIKASSSINSVSLALAVIALHEYALKNKELEEPLNHLIGTLENKIRNSSHQKKLVETHHNFTVKSDNKYVRFPVEALVAYALIIVDHDKLNKGFINDVVKLYEENIIRNRGYLNPEEAPRKSTVNHYWLTLLLEAYVGLEDLRPNETILIALKKHPLLRWVILACITLLIWIGSFMLILHLNANPAFNAFSIIIGSVIAFVLDRIWKNDGKNP